MPPALDLSARDDLRWLAQLLADVRDAVPSAEPLLVGALARDLLLHYGHGIAITRATEDVDLALAIEDWDEFDSVRTALLSTGRFAPYTGAIHKLRYREQCWIDLVPFGAVERADGTIAWPPAGEEVMRVLGYKEANATAIHVTLPESQVVRVVALPMLAVLKVLVWKDRHAHAPRKDAFDLALILRNYLNAGNTDRLYGNMAHLLTADFDFEKAGAWLAGRDARILIQQHCNQAETMICSIADVVLPEIDLEGRLTLVAEMNAPDPESALRLLVAFHRGLTGMETP